MLPLQVLIGNASLERNDYNSKGTGTQKENELLNNETLEHTVMVEVRRKIASFFGYFMHCTDHIVGKADESS